MSSFTVQALIDRLRDGVTDPDAPLDEHRRAHDRDVARAPVAPGVAIRRFRTDAGTIELLTPARGPRLPGTLLWMHGGGYGMGSSLTCRGMVSQLVDLTGATGASLDYRLAPEHPYPAALDDAVGAYRWLLGSGVAAERIVVGGDSSGGGLALALLGRVRAEELPMPVGCLLFSPWVDLTLTASAQTLRTNAHRDPQVSNDLLTAMAARYAGDADPRSPEISPLFADLAGLPRLRVDVGGAEVLLGDTVLLAERVRAAGGDIDLNEWPDMIHVFPAFAPGLGEGRAAIQDAASWLTARWTSARASAGGRGSR
jgi:acetyl esterase/lipase